MYNLTIPQENIWNLQSYYENTCISNICGAVFFESINDSKILENAINKEFEIQCGMRLRFHEKDGKVKQYVSEYKYESIPFVKFDTRETFDKFIKDYSSRPFEMIDSKMHRSVIFELAGKMGWILCANHLISDAWTFSLMVKDVEAHYNALVSGNIIDTGEISYIDYIDKEQKYLTSERYEKDKLYWSERYSEKPEVSSIKTHTKSITVPTSERIVTKLSPEQTSAIDAFCKEHNISQAVLFEAAVIIYLSKVNSENREITIGIPVLNRSNVREKSMAGMFISTNPLSVEVLSDDSVFSLCKRITDAHKSVFLHHKFPYNQIQRIIREKSNFEGNLYDVMVSYQNAKASSDAKTEWYSNGFSEVQVAFHIDNRDSDDSYTLTVDYQTEVFQNKCEVSLLVDRIKYIIEQIICSNEKRLSEINVLPEAEYKKVIYEFNQTEAEYPKDKCVHELFTEQAKKNPDKIALVFENQKFTYKQIDEMSNSLAHYLREQGVERNEIVPIISVRSWHVIVTMLGILKSGAAYMPVDPSYPENRIKYMLNEAKCRLALIFGYEKSLPVQTVNLKNFDFIYNFDKLERV